MPNVIPAPIAPATATTSGVVSTGAQVLGAGVKTFSSGVVANSASAGSPAISINAGAFNNHSPISVTNIGANAGINMVFAAGVGGGSLSLGDASGLGKALTAANATLNLYSTASGAGRVRIIGEDVTSGTGVCVVAGTLTADGSVHANAKLFSIRTGIAGTEVEKASINKAGDLSLGGSLTVNRTIQDSGASGFPLQIVGTNQGLRCDTSGSVAAGSALWAFRNFGTNTAVVTGGGRLDQSGTDSSGTPGAATINKPSGISAIAGGATTVVITNSLVTASSRVRIDWYGDLGTQTKQPWVTRAAGSFTVNVGTAPAGAVAFGWEVSSLI